MPTWNVIEYGDFGAIAKEEYLCKKRVGHVIKEHEKSFCAEVTLKHHPYVEVKIYTTKRSAKAWCEKMIKKDVGKDVV